jgi:putative ABC transport system permease protein
VRRRTRGGPRSRLLWRDLAAEVVATVVARPGRTALTTLGTVLGVGAVVAILGLTATAAGQISLRFTALVATEVTVEKVAGPADETAFPPDAEARVGRIDGVVAAGVFWTAGTGVTVSGVPLPGGEPSAATPVVAATPGLFAAVHARLGAGRYYDDFASAGRQRVAVLGYAAARRLGVTDLAQQPVIFLDSVPFTVVGIVAGLDRRPELLSAVLVPTETARLLWPGEGTVDDPARMLIDTRLGAARTVARQAAVALRPDRAALFRTVAPPDPRGLRDAVDTDLAGLLLVLSAICLVIGAVGIGNTTFVAVLERVGEIGLRRSLGAHRRHIAAQFLAESAVVGTLGALVGCSLGVALVVGVAVWQHWTPVLPPSVVLTAPWLGTLTGVLAGLYPSWRAATVEPVEALRR